MRRLRQMQRHNQAHLYQRAHWKYQLLTRALGRGVRVAKRLQSVADPAVSPHHELVVRYETAVGVGLFFLTPRRSPTQTRRPVTVSRLSAEGLWMTDSTKNQSTPPRR
jgi:class 3 adenylate cyclase